MNVRMAHRYHITVDGVGVLRALQPIARCLRVYRLHALRYSRHRGLTSSRRRVFLGSSDCVARARTRAAERATSSIAVEEIIGTLRPRTGTECPTAAGSDAPQSATLRCAIFFFAGNFFDRPQDFGELIEEEIHW